MTNPGVSFRPDWVSPPGETIIDLIEEREWSQAELAQRLGYTPKHLNQLIKGKAALTEDAALRLERVLGSTANFWLNREAKYREHLARIEAQERYQNWIDWLDKLPLSDLKKQVLFQTSV
jgi:HTH-type transcriptional regulator / antitoxin HigA